MQVQFKASTGKYSQTPKSRLYKKLCHCETKKFRRKSWYLFLCTKFLDTRNFQKHRRPLLQKFWYFQTKIFSMKNRDTPVLHSFLVPETFRNSKTAPSRFFLSRPKIFDILLWYPEYGSPNSSHPTNSSARNFHKYQRFPEIQKGTLQ